MSDETWLGGVTVRFVEPAPSARRLSWLAWSASPRTSTAPITPARWHGTTAMGEAEMEASARAERAEAQLAALRAAWEADETGRIDGALFELAAAEAHDERMRAEGAERGLTTLDTMRAALRHYPDADFSAHRVRAEEVLALDERRDFLAKSRRRWIDAIAPILGDDSCCVDDVPALIEAHDRRVRVEALREARASGGAAGGCGHRDLRHR